jgi:hypothetical protein
MKYKILTYINIINKHLMLLLACGLSHAVMASIDSQRLLDNYLAVPMQGNTIMESYQPRTYSTPTRIQHYTPTEANYSAQALRSGTRTVNSYGGGRTPGDNQIATMLPSPQAGTPTAIRDIDTWKRTHTSSPTLADEDITLADEMMIQRLPGNKPTDDDDTQSAVTPIGNGTGLLILLAVGYAIFRRKKTQIA